MAERDLAERGRERAARDGLHPVSNPARLTGGVCAVRNGLHPMPYLMRLSRYSLLAQFILAQFILTQTASAQLLRHRRLAGAPHLSLGALSSLTCSEISWSQMGVLLALIPVLVDWSSMSRSSLSSFSSPLSKFSEFVSRTSSDRIDGGGEIGASGRLLEGVRKSQNASLSRHSESCAWRPVSCYELPERTFLPHARTGICDRFSIFPVEKSVDLPRNSADFGAKMAKNRKNSLGK